MPIEGVAVPGVVVLENVGDRLPVLNAGRLEINDPCHPVLPCIMEVAPYMAVGGHASRGSRFTRVDSSGRLGACVQERRMR
jgi:hypothetical protein